MYFVILACWQSGNIFTLLFLIQLHKSNLKQKLQKPGSSEKAISLFNLLHWEPWNACARNGKLLLYYQCQWNSNKKTAGTPGTFWRMVLCNQNIIIYIWFTVCKRYAYSDMLNMKPTTWLLQRPCNLFTETKQNALNTKVNILLLSTF